MDRKQAQQFIGKFICVNEGREGTYIGILNEIITPPRKVWRGKVTVRAVKELPAFSEDGNFPHLPPLKYKENEVIECPGTKLFSLDHSERYENKSFRESLIDAANDVLDEIERSKRFVTSKEDVLKNFLAEYDIDIDKERKEKLIDYRFLKRDGRYYLINESGERLELQDCPFEFIWKDGNHTFYGHYEGNGTFITHEGMRYTPKEGAIFSMSQKQFDPYFILQNELEPEALLSLEHNLQKFGLTHEDLVDCHNTLLAQFLTAKGERTFKGVNFLTYRNHKSFVVVQHHYERTLNDNKDDEIYDRFEFTSSNGERAIATFTNVFTKGK